LNFSACFMRKTYAFSKIRNKRLQMAAGD